MCVPIHLVSVQLKRILFRPGRKNGHSATAVTMPLSLSWVYRGSCPGRIFDIISRSNNCAIKFWRQREYEHYTTGFYCHNTVVRRFRSEKAPQSYSTVPHSFKRSEDLLHYIGATNMAKHNTTHFIFSCRFHDSKPAKGQGIWV